MNVCIYLRVSSSVQVDGISLQLQEERLRAYAASQGWEVVERYEDAGLSGSTTDRPAFQRMMEDAKRGRFQAVLVYKLDRLTRSVRDFHELADELESKGVAIVSVTQNIDTSSPTGRLLRNILIDFANFERELIAERSTEGKRRLAAGGRYLGWEPPFGYRKVGERANARLVVVPEEADVVREIFRLYLTGQYGDVAIARRVGMSANRVRRILLNPTYTGKIAYTKRRGSNHISVEKMDDWIIAPGYHEAIIDEEAFWRAVEVRKRNTLGTGPRNRSGHLFSRLVVCGRCENAMRLAGSGGGGPNEPYRMYYRCDRRHVDHRCDQRPVRHEALEFVFLAQLQRVVDTPSFWTAAEKARAAHAKARPSAADTLARLEGQRSSILRRIDNLVTALEEGELAATIRPRLAQLNRERQQIEAEMRRLEQAEEDARATSPEVTRALMRNVASNWNAMTVEEKREGIRILAKRLVVAGEDVAIHWTDPHLPPATSRLPARWARINV